MPKFKMTVARVAEVCARLLNCESRSSIRKHTGMATATINKAIETMRLFGVVVETVAQDRRDPAREAPLYELFRITTLSNREIVAATGINLNAVNRARKQFDAELVHAGGQLPVCECGQYLHHARMCWARHRKHMKERGVRAVVTLEPEQQADVRRRLLDGATMRSVAELTNLPKSSIGSFVRNLSPDERRAREDRFVVASARRRAARLAQAISRPAATNPSADPLYAEISRAVPRGIDAALRDDMISEAYIEVLEGRLNPKKLREGVKKIRGKVFRTFANPWGNRSIDAPLYNDGASWADAIPDDRALQSFEAIA